MKGDEVLVMTSRVIIFAVFLRMWVYPRPQFWFKDLAEEIDNAVGSVRL